VKIENIKGFVIYILISMFVPFALSTLYAAITCNISIPEAMSWVWSQTGNEYQSP